MLKSDPDDTFLLYALAMTCIADNDVEEGLRRLDHVLEHDPAYVAAYFQKGQALSQLGQMESAKEIITRGIEVAKSVADQHAMMEMSAFLETL